MRQVTYLLSCCLLLQCRILAQAEQFKEWQFQVPAGWQFTTQGDTALLSPVNEPAGTVYIKLFPGRPLSGDLQSWLEEQATQDTQGMTVVDSKPAKLFPAGRPSVFQKTITIQISNGRKAARMYFGESPVAGRGELILIYGEIPQARNYTEAMNLFLHGIHFGAMTPPDRNTPTPERLTQTPPVPPSPVSGLGTAGAPSLFNGWYVRSMPRTVPGPNFTFTMRPHWEYYRFFPNGWVYTSFPPTDNLDSISCPQAGIAEGKCEHYSIQGRMITIGRDRAKSLELISADEIKISEVPAWRLRPLQRIPLGTYEAVSGGGGLGTAAIAVSQLTFYPDGTFNSSRSAGVNSTTPGSSASAYRNSGGAGQYNIKGYDLELRYNTGQVIQTKIVAPANNDSDLLVIGNSTYVKKDTSR